MNPRQHSEVASPCVRNCCLDLDDICVGCGRSLQEIKNWSQLSDAQRIVVLGLARDRLFPSKPKI
jgi:predicted Fe-S protein YdhL (DUF1289 family)